jgi:hypothetical protein
MPIAELLNNARFLTNQQGEQTDVLLSIETWNTLLSLLEQLELREKHELNLGLIQRSKDLSNISHGPK